MVGFSLPPGYYNNVILEKFNEKYLEYTLNNLELHSSPEVYNRVIALYRIKE